jgi:hypothetical protein
MNVYVKRHRLAWALPDIGPVKHIVLERATGTDHKQVINM